MVVEESLRTFFDSLQTQTTRLISLPQNLPPNFQPEQKTWISSIYHTNICIYLYIKIYIIHYVHICIFQWNRNMDVFMFKRKFPLVLWQKKVWHVQQSLPFWLFIPFPGGILKRDTNTYALFYAGFVWIWVKRGQEWVGNLKRRNLAKPIVRCIKRWMEEEDPVN